MAAAAMAKDLSYVTKFNELNLFHIRKTNFTSKILTFLLSKIFHDSFLLLAWFLKHWLSFTLNLDPNLISFNFFRRIDKLSTFPLRQGSQTNVFTVHHHPSHF
jgi:hypothetical protein